MFNPVPEQPSPVEAGVDASNDILESGGWDDVDADLDVEVSPTTEQPTVEEFHHTSQDLQSMSQESNEVNNEQAANTDVLPDTNHYDQYSQDGLDAPYSNHYDPNAQQYDPNTQYDPNSQYDPNAQPYDPNSQQYDQNSQQYDPNSQQYDPNSQPYDPNAQYDPNTQQYDYSTQLNGHAEEANEWGDDGWGDDGWGNDDILTDDIVESLTEQVEAEPVIEPTATAENVANTASVLFDAQQQQQQQQPPAAASLFQPNAMAPEFVPSNSSAASFFQPEVPSSDATVANSFFQPAEEAMPSQKQQQNVPEKSPEMTAQSLFQGPSGSELQSQPDDFLIQPAGQQPPPMFAPPAGPPTTLHPPNLTEPPAPSQTPNTAKDFFDSPSDGNADGSNLFYDHSSSSNSQSSLPETVVPNNYVAPDSNYPGLLKISSVNFFSRKITTCSSTLIYLSVITS